MLRIRAVLAVVLVLATAAILTSGITAQDKDKKDDKKPAVAPDAYVLVIKDGRPSGDTVVIVEGIEWVALKSDKAGVEARPKIDGKRLIFEGRKACPVIGSYNTKVSFKFYGTVNKVVDIGVPAGIPVYIGAKERPKE